MEFAKNALFSSFGVICGQPLPSSLPDKELMDGSCFLSTRTVYTVSDSSYNTTDSRSSRSTLAGKALRVRVSADLALVVHGLAAYYVIGCTHAHACGYMHFANQVMLLPLQPAI